MIFSACKDQPRHENIQFKNPESQAFFHRVEEQMFSSRFEEADHMLDSIEKTDLYRTDVLVQLTTLNTRGNILHHQHKYREAIDMYQQVVDIGSLYNTKYNYTLCDAYYNMGENYFRLGNYQIAYQKMFKGRELGEKVLDMCIIAHYDYRLAMILYRQEKYDEARNYFLSSFDNYRFCFENFTLQFRRQELLNNIGLCSYQTGAYDTALYYYRQADAYLQQIPVIVGTHERSKEIAHGVIQGNIGKAFLALNQPDSALVYLKDNIAINTQEHSDINDALTSMVSLSKIYLEKREFEHYRKLISRALSIADSLNASKEKLSLLRMNIDYYTIVGDHSNALASSKEYIYLNDSVKNARYAMFNSDVSLSISKMEQEHQINLLKRDNDIKTNYVMLISVSVVLLIMVLIVTIVYLISIRKKNRDLADLNDLINRQKDQMEESKKQLEQAYAELIKKDSEKNKILSIVAHDLRNPINNVHAITDIFMEEDVSDEEFKTMLNHIRLSCQSSLDIINEILLTAKPRSALQMVSTNLLVFLRSIIDRHQYKAKEKDLIIELDTIDPSLRIQINEEKFGRLLGNLISNAIKFSDRGKQILLKAYQVDEDHIQIEVKDWGIGIPQEFHDTLFSSATVKRPGTDGESSFGLGLSIVRQLVEMHHASIWFSSEEGRGTVFYIRIAAEVV